MTFIPSGTESVLPFKPGNRVEINSDVSFKKGTFTKGHVFYLIEETVTSILFLSEVAWKVYDYETESYYTVPTKYLVHSIKLDDVEFPVMNEVA